MKYFLSDCHIGDGGPSDEFKSKAQRLVNLLDRIMGAREEGDVQELILLGDIVDDSEYRRQRSKRSDVLVARSGKRAAGFVRLPQLTESSSTQEEEFGIPRIHGECSAGDLSRMHRITLVQCL